ncbi:MAG TPA: tetratricopeptide repeat protein [Candidatus Obscuribacterales bacterium]
MLPVTPSSTVRQILAYAAVAYQAQRYDDAIAYLEEVVAVCTDDWQAMLCLGSAYRMANAPWKAKHQLTHVAEHAPAIHLRKLACLELKRLIASEAVLSITSAGEQHRAS